MVEILFARKSELDAFLATTLTAGAGLTGGGTFGTSLTVNVGAGTGITVNADDVAITATGVTAATYGSATQAPQIAVNAQGQIITATDVTIAPLATSIASPAALTRVDDTNVTLTLGGTPGTAILRATSLTLGWTGTLAVARGGTGSGTSTGSGSVVLATSPTLTTPVLAGDDAYDATTWNGNLAIPTKNAVRDKIESLSAAVLQTKVGSFTRDISTASGTQAITGVGFQPKALWLMASVTSTLYTGWAFFDSALAAGGLYNAQGLTDNVVNPFAGLRLLLNATDIYDGQISAFGADGFTVSWTKAGSPTGTATIYYMAIG